MSLSGLFTRHRRNSFTPTSRILLELMTRDPMSLDFPALIPEAQLKPLARAHPLKFLRLALEAEESPRV